ncbi:MAG: 4-hydroxythreonine-4-phosphate dehydrogenase PdxA, partial [Candidatus Puniceispirillales bacterium]
HAIRDAVAMVQSGLVDALVTNPIQKRTLHDAGFSYPGHTEYLASLDDQNDIHPVMMLVNPVLRVVPLTIHMPLKDIFAHITSEHIIRTVRIMAQSLISDFGIKTPHIAVAGLNPHAGENGMLGNEEQMIIAPAIASLQAEGLAVTGPYSADTLFFHDKHDSYDAVLAMYHDQALIPVKTLDFHHGVNATLGLSFIRTSPDHGTALDQAGQFTARPNSLIAAIELAQFMAKHRRNSINRQIGLSS